MITLLQRKAAYALPVDRIRICDLSDPLMLKTPFRVAIVQSQSSVYNYDRSLERRR